MTKVVSAEPVAMTQWIDAPKNAASEDIISYTARVSNPLNQENFDTSSGLLKYCIKEKHWSIFTMSNIVMEINAPRDISRQLLRHTFDFQEFSQRYANVTDEFSSIIRETRMQDKNNRQNSLNNYDHALKDEWGKVQKAVDMHARNAYDWAISKGIAKEQARVILPEGLTMSRLYVNGTLRTWYHYCEVRRHESTQLEHRQLADDCWKILKEHYPFLAEIEAMELEAKIKTEVAKDEQKKRFWWF